MHTFTLFTPNILKTMKSVWIFRIDSGFAFQDSALEDSDDEKFSDFLKIVIEKNQLKRVIRQNAQFHRMQPSPQKLRLEHRKFSL